MVLGAVTTDVGSDLQAARSLSRSANGVDCGDGALSDIAASARDRKGVEMLDDAQVPTTRPNADSRHY